MNKKLIAGILMSSILLSSTPAFASTINQSSNSTATATNTINTNTNHKFMPLVLTKYEWSTKVYTSPNKWFRVSGPSRGGFELKNSEGTHYKTLYVRWSSNVVPKNMKIEIKNDDTGGVVTHTVSGKNDQTYFTDLRAGHYTVYIMTGNWNSLKVYVEDFNPGR